MFDFVRKHTKLMMALMFALIIPSFVLVGMDGFSKMQDNGAAVARVDGRDIKQSEWDAAHKVEADRMRQSMPSLDPKLLDSPEARYATLERLVRERVLAAAVTSAKLTASDQRVARELQQNEVIASLRGPDGRLDMARYRQLLSGQGMTPEMFESTVRADLSTRQVLLAIGNTGFSAPAPAAVALNAFFEKREVQVARFDTTDYAAKLNPPDADIEAYYKANPQLFQAPEQANIEYVVLDLDAVKKSVNLVEQDVKSYYDQNVARLSGKEERRASHILLASPASAAPAEREKAKARAEELLAAVRKSPDSFADVAKKNSQDPGSAPNGGDLDFFARGAMTKAFEEAAFALKKGEISPVVETEFGFHIIKLTDLKAPKQRTYEEMKPEIEADLKKQQAQTKFAEQADAFSNAVYEQSDNLKAVAERFKLELRTATNVRRTAAPGATGVLTNPKFLNSLFSADSVEKKRNTEAVEAGASQLISGRLTQYTPARTLPLAEVKDQVRTRLLAARGAEQARKEGAEKLAAWKANAASATLPAAVTVSREDPQKLPGEVVEAALRADPAAFPALLGVDLGAQGYAVVRVNKTVPRAAPSDEIAKAEREQYAKWWTQAEGVAYLNLLKDRFKTQIKVPRPDASGSPQVATQ